MSNSSEPEKYEVCFVKNNRAEDVTENLKLAFEAMQSKELDPIWMTEDACLKIDNRKGRLIVTDPFEGKVYDHIKSIQCRIIGPLCVLSCLELGERLPKRPHPVYSVAMRRMTVTCSNLDKKSREHICNRVQLLGGTFSKDFTKSVTHLIAGEVGSEKYHVAAKMKIPIMLPPWVEEVWSKGQFQKLHASDPVYKKFSCPVFKGLSITVSQLSSEDRAEVLKLVESNGGRYSGVMRSRDTTHLILLEAKGDKYKFALAWKLHCVKKEWLYDSISAGYCMNEKLYQLDPVDSGPKRSTPIKDKSNEKLIVDCSAINASLASQMNETVQSDMSVMVNRCSIDALDTFNISSLRKCGQFLDGCKIYLTGFKTVHLEKLRKIVNAGGGIRFSKFSDSISHVVCGEKDHNLLEYVKNSTVKPYVVNFMWLLQCCTQEKLVDESPYICAEFAGLSPHKNAQDCTQPSASFCAPPPQPVPVPCDNGTEILNKDVTMPDNFSEIMKQYAGNEENTVAKNLPDKDSKSPGNANSSKSSSMIVSTETKKECNDHESGNTETSDVNEKVSTLSMVQDKNSIFAGMTFIIIGFNESDTKIFENAISANAGVVLGLDESSVDVAVVPLVWNKNVSNVNTVATSCWLQKCVEEECLLPFDGDELFKPFKILSSCQPLKNTVISISQYTGVIRETLAHLATVLGATCQDYFVRRASPKRGMLASTHLILRTPDGDKYAGSKRWQLPAVTKYWLFDAANSKTLPPVQKYLIDNQRNAQDIVVDEDSNSTKDSEKLNSSGVKRRSHRLQERESINPSVDTETGNNDEREHGSKTSKSIRVKELIEDNRKFSAKSSSSNSSSGRSPLPDKPYFDVSSILRDLDSSVDSIDGKPDKNNVSMSVGELMDKNLNLTLKKLGYRSDSENTEQSNDGIMYDCQRANDSGQNIASKTSSNSSNENVLNGVIACVSKKLGDIRAEINEIIISLGGEFRWSFDETCTHYIFRGKLNDVAREFREAKRLGKKIVCPEWVHACRDSGTRVNESLFPHTLKPGLTLSDLSTVKSVPNTSVMSNAEHESDGSFLSPKPVPQKNKFNQNGEHSTDVSKQLDELIFAAKTAKAGKRRTRQNVNSSVDSPTEKCVSKISTASPRYPSSTSDAKYKFQHIDGASSEPSQGVPITWDDPTGRLERERIAAISTTDENRDPLFNEQGDMQSANKTSLQDTKMEMTCSSSKSLLGSAHRFMFTSVPEEERKKYSTIVTELGGIVPDTNFFDEEASHLILGQPIKNEKFLASVASGKWVLHKSYLDDSLANKEFLPEESYEWGGEETKSFISKNSTTSMLKMSVCPRRWRVKLASQEDRKGAFHDWKVVLITDKSKTSSYCKILKAGGANVFVPPSIPNDLSMLTHAFIEIGKNSDLSVDLEPLIVNRVKCMKPEYLAYYLIDDPPPPESDYFHPGAKQLLGEINSSHGHSKRHSDTSRNSSTKRARVC